MSVWKLFSDNGQDRLCYASMEHPVYERENENENENENKSEKIKIHFSTIIKTCPGYLPFVTIFWFIIDRGNISWTMKVKLFRIVQPAFLT
jgi:hypothetical protein